MPSNMTGLSGRELGFEIQTTNAFFLLKFVPAHARNVSFHNRKGDSATRQSHQPWQEHLKCVMALL